MEVTKKDLQGLHLQTLREVGRKVGVRAPAALKKDDLINGIIDVVSGKVPPRHAKSGRPCIKDNLENLQVSFPTTFNKDEYLDNLIKNIKVDKDKQMDNVIKQLKIVLKDLLDLLELIN